MSRVEVGVNRNPEIELPQQILSRVEKISSENWHSIPVHSEPESGSVNSKINPVWGYETVLHLSGQAFTVQLELVGDWNTKRMTISKPEREGSLKHFFYGSEREESLKAYELLLRLESEVGLRETKEQKTRARALQIDLEAALYRDSKMK